MLLLPFNRERRLRVAASRVLISRCLELVFRRQRDARLSDEIRAHLDELADGFVARGLSPADAQIAARRAFGGVDQVMVGQIGGIGH